MHRFAAMTAVALSLATASAFASSDKDNLREFGWLVMAAELCPDITLSAEMERLTRVDVPPSTLREISFGGVQFAEAWLDDSTSACVAAALTYADTGAFK